MKLLVLSDIGHSLGIASHLSSEGHAVQLVMGTETRLGEGIVEVGREFTGYGDITVFDGNRLGRAADEARKSGARALGASLWSDLLETEPRYQQDIIKAVGWPTQELTGGTHLYITGWFNGTRFIASYVSLLYRRLMAGGAGPDLGCTGVISNFEQPTNKIYETFLAPLEPVLRRVNHRGCVHVHSLIRGDSYSVKEISASFSHALSLLIFENSNLSVADILLRLFDEASKPVKCISPWASSVQLSVPPYPYQISYQPVEIKGIVPGNLKHLWLMDVYRDNGTWKTATLTGCVGYVTARGIDIQETVRRMYRTVRNLTIPDIQYRNDVGRNVHNLIEGLNQAGWIKQGGSNV